MIGFFDTFLARKGDNMDKTGFSIESIALAHRFFAPPHWVFGEYKSSRPKDGIIYVLDGSATYEMEDGNRISVHRDDLLYMPKNTHYLTRCGDDPFHHMTINFTVNGELPLPQLRHCEAFERTKQEMTRIVNEWAGRHPYYRERCLGLLYLFLCGQIQLLEKDAAGAAERVQNAMILLNGDNKDTITVSALAESCNMSETYFRRLFFRAFGVSPQNYITRKKVSYACDLLLNTGLSVEEISYESGYRDSNYFCRIFKKEMGCSPSFYRKRGAEK